MNRFFCLLSLLCFALFIVGCKTELKGGTSLERNDTLHVDGAQTRADLGIASIDLRADGGVTISYHRDRTATTQPTTQQSTEIKSTTQPGVVTEGSATPRYRTDDAGNTWISFDQIRAPPRQFWPLFGLFAVGAFACWKWGGNIPAALACCGLAILSVVWSTGLIYLALAAIAIALWTVRKTIVQLVQGNNKTLEKSSPDLAERLKDQWASQHDESTQRVVKGLR